VSNASLYERDFYAWVNQQSGLLRFRETFPAAWPWPFEQMTAEDFWPDEFP
jgi:hypothetical protein